MNIDKNSSYYFKNHLAWQIEPISETVYVLDKKNGGSYLFEGIAKDIWKMIHMRMSVRNIIDLLAPRYDILKPQLEEDIISFIDKIIGEELIYEV